MLIALEEGRHEKAKNESQKVLDGLLQGQSPESLGAPGMDAPALRKKALLVKLLASVRHQDHDTVATIVPLLNEEDIDLGNYSAILLLRGADAEDDCEEATKQLNELSAGSVFYAPGARRVFQCWLRKKEFNRARISINQFELSESFAHHQDTVRLLRGQLLEAMDEQEKAHKIYRELLSTATSKNALKKAEERLDELREKGFKGPLLSPFEQIARADTARSRQRLKTAQRMYVNLRRQVDTEMKKLPKKHASRPELKKAKRLADLGLIEIEMVNRSYRQAQKRLENLIYFEDPEVQARALYLMGDVRARRGQLAQSLKTFKKLIRKHPDDPFAVEGALSAAQMSYSARFLRRARGFAQWIVQREAVRERSSVVDDDGVHRRPSQSGSAQDHSYWLLAWNERRSGALPQVMDSYLSQIDTRGPLGLAVLYWRARLAIDAEDLEAAQVFIEMLRMRAPTSYYALAGRDILRAAGYPTPEGPDFPTLYQEGASNQELPQGRAYDLRAALTFTQAGLLSAARKYLRTIPMRQLSEDDRTFAAWVYRASGEPHLGALLARRLVQRPRHQIQDQALFEIAYPRPFDDLVRRYTDNSNTPEDLIFAIMREESSFNPQARSPRYARGLMQMIQPTAKRMASEVKLKRFKTNQLFKPDISIRLGVHYVKSLLTQFDGNIVAAIASYHAGEDRVARWLKTRSHMRLDEFIEDIPFESTRRYVKKVLSSYGVYRLLYRENPNEVLGIMRTAHASPRQGQQTVLASTRAAASPRTP